MHFNDIIALFCIVAILTWASPGVGQGERPPPNPKNLQRIGKSAKASASNEPR